MVEETEAIVAGKGKGQGRGVGGIEEGGVGVGGKGSLYAAAMYNTPYEAYNTPNDTSYTYNTPNDTPYDPKAGY
jgi:hypothetical protein